METLTPIEEENKVLTILLLTNRDSDNVGDQVIEACDIGLVHTVMQNLGYTEEQYKISSRAAGIITQKYLATKDPALLQTAEDAISGCDIVIFGGAPLFNYAYQTFYERTAVTLEIAKKYNKPVLFSAIGVEGYDEDNEKCQRLKKTLNFDCVKQITTRDDFPRLQMYKNNEQLVIDKVADPAVFSSTVLRNFTSEKIEKKIGLFVLRANGFKDNKVDFSKDEASALWVNLVNELTARGYDCELLTSGHFGDEAFLDYLTRTTNLALSKCIFNINSPEQLIKKLSTYDGVVSCRLHPSIISFSFDIPSVGLVWNNKVKEFYNCIGYPDRILEVEDITVENVINKLETAMAEGIKKDTDYLSTVYNSLFQGIKNILNIQDASLTPYSYAELLDKIPAFKGTSQYEQGLKLERKFRRTYKTYNIRFQKNEQQQATIRELKAHEKELNAEIKKLTSELNNTKKQLETTNKQLNTIKNLKSYKFATMLAYIPRKLKKIFKGN